MPEPVFSSSRLVMVGDDDGSGLIYFPVPFQYMSEAEQTYWQQRGRPIVDQISAGIAAPAVHAECDYLGPVRAGETVVHTMTILPGDRSSYTVEHEFRNEQGDVVIRGRMVRVFVNLETMRSRPIPGWFHETLQALDASGEPEKAHGEA